MSLINKYVKMTYIRGYFCLAMRWNTICLTNTVEFLETIKGGNDGLS